MNEAFVDTQINFELKTPVGLYTGVRITVREKNTEYRAAIAVEGGLELAPEIDQTAVFEILRRSGGVEQVKIFQKYRLVQMFYPERPGNRPESESTEELTDSF